MRGGVLTVTGGVSIAIATREAVAGDDLATLDPEVLARFQSDADAERVEHAETMRLQLERHPPHGQPARAPARTAGEFR